MENNNKYVLPIIGPSNLFSILENELDLFDLNDQIKTMRKWHRVPPTKNLYIVNYNNSKQNLLLYEKIKNKLKQIDPKAVITASEYMVNSVDSISPDGQYLFVHSDQKDECIGIMQNLLNLLK